MAIDMLIRKKWDKFSLDINFKSQSKRIGILGASGCGKSMTLKSIAGIETPDSGHIKIDGNILFDKETKTNLKTQKRKVGYLFQNYALFPSGRAHCSHPVYELGASSSYHKRKAFPSVSCVCAKATLSSAATEKGAADTTVAIASATDNAFPPAFESFLFIFFLL